MTDTEYPTRPERREPLPPDTLVSEVDQVFWTAGWVFEGREDLVDFVEQPLLRACQMFFDKKIRTIESSANRNNVPDGFVYILVDYDELTTENRQVADRLTEVVARYDRRTSVLRIPVNARSTIGLVDELAVAAAEVFRQQDRWRPHPLTADEALEELSFIRYREEPFTVADLTASGAFEYDKASGLYYYAD